MDAVEEKLSNYEIEREKPILRDLIFEPIEGHAESSTCDNEVVLIPNIPFNDDFLQQNIFHQLGHCVLNREHTDEKLPNGEWKSLMSSDISLGFSGLPIDYTGIKKHT